MSHSNNAQAIHTVAPSEKSDNSINSEQVTELVEQAKKKLKIDWSTWAPFIAIAGLFVAQTAVFMAIFIFLVEKIDGTVQPVLAKSIENGERLVKVELEVANLKNQFASLEQVVVELDKKVVIIEEKMVELDEKMVELDGKVNLVDGKLDILIAGQKSNGQ